MLRRLLLSLLVLAPVGSAGAGDAPPPVAREFRAAWVATVANIDWPSKPGLAEAEQRRELTAILDQLQSLNFNAVILQVRPMCDALYPSELEPWSEFLTGTPGESPGYDPLAFAVDEAHKRGLELHAWFNPYRAGSPAAKKPPAKSHLSQTHPEWVKTYGKHLWLNPTNPAVQDHSLAVIADVVKRYDLDGVHLDDYFYPYPELDGDKNEIPFPDDDTWEAYQKSGGALPRNDWRRDAVNQFVARLYQQTKVAKPHVKVGISPFGIYQPGTPAGIAGFNQYEKLYADAKLWLNEGWVDYYTPQLYWPIAQEKQSYRTLLKWWMSENTHARHLWPGNFSTKATAKNPGWSPQELIDQIELTREMGAGGNVHFSAKPVLASKLVTGLLKKAYREPALVPETPWLVTPPPMPPVVQVADGQVTVAADANASAVTVQTLTAGQWATRVVPRPPGDAEFRHTFPAGAEKVVVGAVGRNGKWVAAK